MRIFILLQISILAAEPSVCEEIGKCSHKRYNVGKCHLKLENFKESVKTLKVTLCDHDKPKSSENGEISSKWMLDNVMSKIVCAPAAIFESLQITLENCKVSTCAIYQIVVDYIQETTLCGDKGFKSVSLSSFIWASFDVHSNYILFLYNFTFLYITVRECK